MNEHRDQAQDKDWEAISELLHKTDCVPDAPDCRSAVMARIAKPKPVRRFVWAYATGFAALLVAAIGLAPFLMNSGEIDRIAILPKIKHSSPASEKTSKPPLYAFDSTPVAGHEQPQQPRARHIRSSKPVLMAKATPSEARIVANLGDRVSMGTEYKAAPPTLDTAKDKSRVSVDYYSKAVTSAKAANEDSGTMSGGYKLAMPASKPADRSADLGSSLAYDYQPSTPQPARARPAKPGFGTVVAASPPPAAQPDTAVAGRHEIYADTPASLQTTLARDAVVTMNDAAESSRPVAVAIVTWPSANNSHADSYSYGYKNRDVATGRTTECRVKRSGNSVEIYMESKPEAPQPPVKGSIEHETKPSA